MSCRSVSLRHTRVTGVLSALALLVGCGNAGPTEPDDQLDPYDPDEWALAGVIRPYNDYEAVAHAPIVAALRLDAALWDGSCPVGTPGWWDRADSDHQAEAMDSAAWLGDFNALSCVVSTHENMEFPEDLWFAYEALILTDLWGGEASDEQLRLLELELGSDQALEIREFASMGFEGIQLALAYEREHGPIPPELGRDLTYEARRSRNPAGIEGPLPESLKRPGD